VALSIGEKVFRFFRSDGAGSTTEQNAFFDYDRLYIIQINGFTAFILRLGQHIIATASESPTTVRN